MGKKGLGIDLGGTNTEIVVQDVETGQVWEIRKFETLPEEPLTNWIERLNNVVDNYCREQGIAREDLVRACLASPGPMDLVARMLLEPANLNGPGWANAKIADMVEEALGIETLFENDANAAGFGEFAGRTETEIMDMIILTLGTGIGGAVISGGRIVHGANSMGGELGHTTVAWENNPRSCGCGNKGCVEAYSSAAALRLWVPEELGRRVDVTTPLREWIEEHSGNLSELPAEIHRLFVGGDEFCKHVMHQQAGYLARAIRILSVGPDPAAFVFAGGMVSPELLKLIQFHYEKICMVALEGKTIIRAAEVQNAGVMGAAALAKSHYLAAQMH